jgi:hypothetical protein
LNTACYGSGHIGLRHVPTFGQIFDLDDLPVLLSQKEYFCAQWVGLGKAEHAHIRTDLADNRNALVLKDDYIGG